MDLPDRKVATGNCSVKTWKFEMFCTVQPQLLEKGQFHCERRRTGKIKCTVKYVSLPGIMGCSGFQSRVQTQSTLRCICGICQVPGKMMVFLFILHKLTGSHLQWSGKLRCSVEQFNIVRSVCCEFISCTHLNSWQNEPLLIPDDLIKKNSLL